MAAIMLEKPADYTSTAVMQEFQAKKQSYSLGQRVQLDIDVNQQYIDFQNSRLFFEIHFTVASTKTASLTKWAASQIIENLRVKTLGGTLIGQEVRDYNAYAKMMLELKSNSDLNDSYYRVLEGAEKTGTSGTTGVFEAGVQQVTFAHKILLHIPAVKKYYPAHFHQGLRLEFDLPSQQSSLFNYDAALTTVTIENIRYVARLVTLDQNYTNAMLQLMEAGKLNVDYPQVFSQRDSLTNSTGKQEYEYFGLDGRVKSGFSYMISDSAQAETTSIEIFSAKAQKFLSSYRWRLGSEHLNYSAISCAEDDTKATSILNRAEQVFELMKALDIHHDDAIMMTSGNSGLGVSSFSLLNSSDNLKTSNFVIGIKADKAQAYTDKTISSRVDKQRNNMRLELTFGTAPGASVTLYTHILLDKSFKILPGNQIAEIRNYETS